MMPLLSRRFKVRSLRPAKALLWAFLAVSVGFPLISLVPLIAGGGADAALSSPAFFPAAGNTLLLSFLGAAVSTSLALAVSLAMSRSHVRHPAAWIALLTLPMLMPSIAHGLGIVYLFGSGGVITSLLGAGWDIYGLPGLLLASLLYSFPPAFLIVFDAFSYERASAYDAADVMGLPRMAQFRAITLPLLAKPLVSAFFSSFVLIATDYGVPLVVGGKFDTIALLMYRSVVGSLDLSTGAGYGVALLVPAFAAFLVDIILPGASGRGGARRHGVRSSWLFDSVAFGLRAIVAAYLVLPVFTFAFVAFSTKWPINLAPTLSNASAAFSFGMGIYLRNSVLIALLASLLGTVAAWVAGYVSGRMEGAEGRVMHLACLLTMAVPGLVLGLAYMAAFQGTILYRTFALLVMVDVAHFLVNPYLMARNALSSCDTGLEGAADVLGIPRRNLLLDVLLPQTWGTVCEMASYIFANSMVTISAVSFLAGVATSPLSLLISDFESQALVECAAVVALVILAANLVARAIFSVLSRAFHGAAVIKMEE